MAAMVNATGCSPNEVRDVPDSLHGRHFADDVATVLATGAAASDATSAATTRWLSWTIERAAARDDGIPHRFSCLTGFVVHTSITNEAAS